jgi:hypothetical protein
MRDPAVTGRITGLYSGVNHEEGDRAPLPGPGCLVRERQIPGQRT